MLNYSCMFPSSFISMPQWNCDFTCLAQLFSPRQSPSISLSLWFITSCCPWDRCFSRQRLCSYSFKNSSSSGSLGALTTRLSQGGSKIVGVRGGDKRDDSTENKMTLLPELGWLRAGWRTVRTYQFRMMVVWLLAPQGVVGGGNTWVIVPQSCFLFKIALNLFIRLVCCLINESVEQIQNSQTSVVFVALVSGLIRLCSGSLRLRSGPGKPFPHLPPLPVPTNEPFQSSRKLIIHHFTINYSKYLEHLFWKWVVVEMNNFAELDCFAQKALC